MGRTFSLDWVNELPEGRIPVFITDGELGYSIHKLTRIIKFIVISNSTKVPE